MVDRGTDDAVFVGDVNPDLVLASPGLTVAFGQREVLVDDATLTLGGSAAIAACGAARMGLQAAVVGLIGDDTFGRFCREALTSCGVDDSGIVVDPDIGTALTVALQRDGDRAILTHAAAIAALSPDRLPGATLDAARHIHVASVFMLDGLRAGLAEILATARRRGATVSLDPNWDPHETFVLDEILPHVDVLLPNAEEARRIAGHTDLERAVTHLAKIVPTVAVTDGEDGAIGVQAGRIVRVPAPRVSADQVVDAIGAGDTFDAGFIAGQVGGHDLEGSLRLGLAAAAISVTGRGGTGAAFTRADVDAFVERGW